MRSQRAIHFAFVSFVLLLFQADCYPNKPASISGTVANKATFNKYKVTDSNREYKARVEEVKNPENDCEKTKKEYSKTPVENEYEVIIPTAEKISYAGSQLWKVNLKDNKNKAIIMRLRDRGDVSVWGGNVTTIDTLVKSNSIERVTSIFKNKGIPYDVVIKNLQEAIEAENPPPPAEIQELSERKGHRLTWRSYHRLNDIYGYIDYLAKTYPNLCSVKTIGHSTEKRPLKVLKISNGKPNNKAIWIDGGIHAREWISPATVTNIIENLVESFDELSPKLSGLDWYILPVANPDGYEYSHSIDRLWRKNRGGRGNCKGVDLNRNFGYKWGGKGVSRNPCTEIYGGQGPFSEPETAAIKNFIDSTRANWKAYISFHSYGQYILYPWGYDNFVPPDHADLQAVASKAAAMMNAATGSHYRFGPAASTLYPASGGSDDWAKGVKNIKYTYTIELRDTGRYGFILPSSYIIPTAKEALRAVEIIATAASDA